MRFPLKRFYGAIEGVGLSYHYGESKGPGTGNKNRKWASKVVIENLSNMRRVTLVGT